MSKPRRELGAAEAAGLAGVSPHTIRSWVHRGRLHRLPSGKFDADDVVAAAQQTEVRARRAPLPVDPAAALAALEQAVILCRRAGIDDLAKRVDRMARTGAISATAEPWNPSAEYWRL
ncbi:hypothetical protein GCM10009616_08220 [Microlunatus lacustris]